MVDKWRRSQRERSGTVMSMKNSSGLKKLLIKIFLHLVCIACFAMFGKQDNITDIRSASHVCHRLWISVGRLSTTLNQRQTFVTDFGSASDVCHRL